MLEAPRFGGVADWVRVGFGDEAFRDLIVGRGTVDFGEVVSGLARDGVAVLAGWGPTMELDLARLVVAAGRAVLLGVTFCGLGRAGVVLVVCGVGVSGLARDGVAVLAG